MKHLLNISQNKAALLAGFSILIMAIAAGFSYGYVFSELIVKGNPSSTLTRLIESRELFTLGVFSWIIILICDILASFALYVFFGKDQKPMASLMAVLRIIYSVFLGIAIYYLFKVKNIIYNEEILMNYSNSDIEVMKNLTMFEYIWSLGLIIFGLHLLLLALIIYRDKKIPSIFAWLLFIAGPSYFVINLIKSFASGFYGEIVLIETILSVPMALSELLLAIWLIIFAIKKKRSHGYNKLATS